MNDGIRRRMRAALDARRVGMKEASIAAGFGQTYLFDALVGRTKNGVRRLNGTSENFAFVAQIMGLHRRWLLTGEGPMWRAGAEPKTPVVIGGKADKDVGDQGGPEDLVVVIEQALVVLLGLSEEKAKACAGSLADIARNPPQGEAVGRADAIRISVRAALAVLKAQWE